MRVVLWVLLSVCLLAVVTASESEEAADQNEETNADGAVVEAPRHDHLFVGLAMLAVVATFVYMLSRRMFAQQHRYYAQNGEGLFTAVPSGVYETNKPGFRIGDDEDDSLLVTEEGRA